MNTAMECYFMAFTVVLYALLVAIGAAHHEPWADEAQAWLVASDNSWLELQWKYLRHEGSPGLWHTILYLPAHLGLPYETSIASVAAVVAIAGVALFLWHSPLPSWLNALVPFTFFVLYQYAVVARSYCLFLVLLGLAALFLKTWSTRPLRLSIVLVLLSHVSVHGALLSLAFIAQVSADMFAGRREYRSWAAGRGAAAVALFALNGFVLLLLMQRPPDLAFAAIASETLGEGLTAGAHYAGMAFAGHALPLPVANIVLLFGGITLIWAAMRGAVFGLVGAVLLSILAGAQYSNVWHEGALFLAWLFGLWIAWDRFRPQDRFRQRLVTYITTAIVTLHVFYGVATWRQDLFDGYSGAREAARYLKERLAPGQTLWAYDFTAVAIQPYFDRPVFGNFTAAGEGKRFFLWSTRNFQSALPLLPKWQKQLCEHKPDLVFTLRESRYPEKFDVNAFEACGYEIEREFPGTIFFQGLRLNEMTYLLLRRRADS